MERESMAFDVLIVGGGPSGLSAAIRLAQLSAESGRECSVCVVEKGSEIGAHILSGAVIEPRALNELIPGYGDVRSDMQIAHMIHATAGVLMMAALMGHIYMGTIGVKGAYRAMKTGWVDEGWAREHHVLWHEDIKAGKIPAQRSGASQPAAGGAPATQS